MQHSPPSSRSPRIPLQFPHPRHGQHHAQTLHRAQRNPPFWPGQRSLQHQHVRTVAPHTTTRDRTQRVTVRPRQPHRSAHCRGAQVPAIRPQCGAAVGSPENVSTTGSGPSASHQRSTPKSPGTRPSSPWSAWGLGLEGVPPIVLNNSPRAARVRVLDVTPAPATYDIGLFTLKRHLKNPLVSAFWSLLPEAAPLSD